MKKTGALSLSLLLLCGCGGDISAPEETVVSLSEKVETVLSEEIVVSLSETAETALSEEAALSSETENTAALGQYFMINGLLYENTGKKSDALRCGMLDGSFPEVIPENELPRKNGQVNISGAKGWQYGAEPLTAEVQLSDGWYVFAEADIPYERDIDFGLSVSAENVSPSGLTLCFSQSGGEGFEELSTDRSYYIQRETDNGWELCDTVIDSYGWYSVGLSISSDGETRHDIDWEWLYGRLPAGHYRISKTVYPDERFYDACTFRTQFDVE